MVPAAFAAGKFMCEKKLLKMAYESIIALNEIKLACSLVEDHRT